MNVDSIGKKDVKELCFGGKITAAAMRKLYMSATFHHVFKEVTLN